MGLDGTMHPTTFAETVPAAAVIESIYNITSTEVETRLSNYDVSSTYSSPKPTCSLNPTQCADLRKAYYSSVYAGGRFDSSLEEPFCDDASTTFGTEPCTIYIPSVQLVYWPVTTVSGDFCLQNGITVTSNATTPITVEALGTTFTSTGDVYLSYPELIAYAAVSSTDPAYWQTTLTGGFLAIPSSQLQSYREHVPGLRVGDTYSFNFADLPPNHVPVAAYEGLETCRTHPWYQPCQTIFENLYAPALVYPANFKTMDPRFSSCGFDWEGLFDPPTSLATQSALQTRPPAGPPPGQTQAPAPGSVPAPAPALTQTSQPEAATVTFASVPSASAASVVPPAKGIPDGGTPGDPSAGEAPAGTGLSDPPPKPTPTGTASADPPASGAPASAGSGDPPANLPFGVDNIPQGGTSGGATAATSAQLISTADGSGGIGISQGTSSSAASVTLSTNTAVDQAPAPAPEDPPIPAPAADPPQGAANPSGAIFTLGGTIVTASTAPGAVNGDGGSDFIIAGTTLSPGGPALTINGQAVSAATGPASGQMIQYSGTHTTTIPLSALPVPDAPNIATLTLPGYHVVTASSTTNADGKPVIIVGSMTLSAGGPAGTTVGMVLSAGSSALVMSAATGPAPAPTVTGAIFSIDGAALTAAEWMSDTVELVAIGAEKLTVGGDATTLPDGVVLSAASSGVVVSSSGHASTVPFSTFVKTSSLTAVAKETIPSATLSLPAAATSHEISSATHDFSTALVRWLALVGLWISYAVLF